MVAVAAACRKALVNDEWPICLLSCTVYRMLLSPCRDSISCNFKQFLSGGAFSGWRALTIERLLMSGCVQGRELTENVVMKP